MPDPLRRPEVPGYTTTPPPGAGGPPVTPSSGTLTGGLANLADVLWPLWDEENRALHDFVVDTRTIKT